MKHLVVFKTILLPHGASTKDDYYKNMYIQILTGASAGNTRQVQSYVVTDSKTILLQIRFHHQYYKEK